MCDYAALGDVFIAHEEEPYVWFLVYNLPTTVRMLEDLARQNFSVLVNPSHMALARESANDLTIIHAHFSDHQPYLHTNQVIGTASH